jgi:hypothetical protein
MISSRSGDLKDAILCARMTRARAFEEQLVAIVETRHVDEAFCRPVNLLRCAVAIVLNTLCSDVTLGRQRLAVEPTRTASIDIDPPSTPSTGKPIESLF